MSAFLRMYCNRLRERIGLPSDFKMEVDSSTDNILVRNDNIGLGFVITKNACIDFPISRIVREAKENIERIQKASPGEAQAAADAGHKIVKNSELRLKGETVFDRGR